MFWLKTVYIVCQTEHLQFLVVFSFRKSSFNMSLKHGCLGHDVVSSRSSVMFT